MFPSGPEDACQAVGEGYGCHVVAALAFALQRPLSEVIQRMPGRHSFVSNLQAVGVDVVTVSKALGHANVHITLVIYAHSIPRERQGAGDAFGRPMAQSGDKMETLTPETASVA